jgi:hypothetical protein
MTNITQPACDISMRNAVRVAVKGQAAAQALPAQAESAHKTLKLSVLSFEQSYYQKDMSCVHSAAFETKIVPLFY